MYSEYKWVNYSYDGAHHRRGKVDSYLCQPDLDYPDCFKTYFRYGDDFREYVTTTGSVAGYTGKAYSGYIPFDIDSEEVSTSFDNLVKLLINLVDVFKISPKDYLVFFSGNRGFHLLLNSMIFGVAPDENIHKYFGILARKLAEGVNIDTKIYDKTRLFRINNTRHGKTGLYKVYLHRSVLTTINNWCGGTTYPIGDAMRKVAESPQKIEDKIEHSTEPIPHLVRLYQECVEEYKLTPRSIVQALADSDCRNRAHLCLQKMMQGLDSGERNAGLFKLACHYRHNLGMPAQVAYGAVMGTNLLGQEKLEESEIVSLVESAYKEKSYIGCNDELMQKYCVEECIFKK